MSNISQLNTSLEAFYRNSEIPAPLAEAALYSLQAGGKRIRPLLFLETLQAFGVELTAAHYQAAAALEYIHTGSLIHDDLPAMDNDDYRRGKWTNHKVYGEALAILAGDSLFLDPYYLLATADLPAEIIVSLVKELSAASGSLGMVGGQTLDIAAEGKSLKLNEIKRLHSLKTGCLLTFPFVAAGLVAGKDKPVLDSLRQIGASIGLAFQIRDDILDISASFEEIGKTPQKDLIERKSTYVSLLGLDGAKEELRKALLTAKADLSALANFDETAILEIIKKLEIAD